MIRTLKNFVKAKKETPRELSYNHVSLFHWSPNDGRVNFGDHLSKVIVEKVLSQNSLTLDDEVQISRRMLAIGSILHFAKNNDIIWGSGVNGKIAAEEFKAKQLDIRAVRGPLTREFLLKRGFDVPEVYGDPGLLTSFLFGNRFKPTQQKEYIFVPNFHDLPLVQNQPNVVSPLMGWNKVVSEIVKSKLVLASSLHGLIIAESFGIPSRYVRLSEVEGLFKYQDYVYGTGREELEFSTSIQEGLEMGGMKNIIFDPEKLLSAFPRELWK